MSRIPIRPPTKSPEERIIDSADPIKDHALLYYMTAYSDVKSQLDEIANAATAMTRYVDPNLKSDGPSDHSLKPALSGEKLRHEIKRILQLP